MQFGFMKGKGTTDAIFIVRQMQEKFGAKGKKLYFGFVDMEKAFDRVPREVIRLAMRKLGVEEWLVSAVTSMFTDAKTVVRTVYGNSQGFEFEVKVGMHQAILQSFNGLFSRITWVSQHQKSRTILVKPIWVYWSKRQRVAVASAGPYANLHLTPDR